jgi:hypothetical protein
MEHYDTVQLIMPDTKADQLPVPGELVEISSDSGYQSNAIVLEVDRKQRAVIFLVENWPAYPSSS